MTISEHEPANFRCGNAYGITRSDDAVLIQITVFATRTAEQKSALYRRIASNCFSGTLKLTNTGAIRLMTTSAASLTLTRFPGWTNRFPARPEIGARISQ